VMVVEQYYHDGATYIGRFTKDNRDGWGTNYWPDKRRKYEGEWNGDDPICGRWSTMTAKDFDMLAAHHLHWPPALEDVIKDGFPQEQEQVPLPVARVSVPWRLLQVVSVCRSLTHVCGLTDTVPRASLSRVGLLREDLRNAA
jgi:hypothetical protein